MSEETTTHLAALLHGLEIPNMEWWVQQSPGAIKKLGESISERAKQAQQLEQTNAQLAARVERLEGELTWTVKTLEWLSDEENKGGISVCANHGGHGFLSDCAICSKLKEIKALLAEQPTETDDD